MDLRYIKILRLALRTIASWPGQELGEHVRMISNYYIYYLLLSLLIALIPVIRYVIQNAKTMHITVLGHICISVLLTFTSTAKIPLLCLRKEYRKFGKMFFTEIHLVYTKNKSEYAMKTHLRVHKLSEYCSIYLISMLSATIIFFNLGPMYVNYSTGLYRDGIPENSTNVYAHAAYYAGFPFQCDYLRDFDCYIVVSLFTWYISYFVGTFLSILDLYIYITVFHIWGHYKILINDLETIAEPNSNGKYSAEESHNITERLKNCIKYHHIISEYTKKMSDLFGATLFANICFMQLVSCLLLLECSYMTAETTMRYGPLTVMVFQELIQFGLVFELTGTAGDDLRKQVYNIPWEYMDTKNRAMVLFFLMNVQKPVRVKALGLTEMGLATVASVIKTSFSYFAFLRTID
ncbi:odorant receptor 13a [Plodia interpunctella]|uniref:odorant receptor 13a n=1 Tax=Plodia interpunctella TaxID=58824 RepID=UPI0023680479|nr:odorant receptor 13a-like [Plodia interpunctella]